MIIISYFLLNVVATNLTGLEKIKYIRVFREKSGKNKPLIRIQSIHSAISRKEEEFLRLWDGIADRVNFIADQKRSLNEDDYEQNPAYICPSPWQRACISWDGKVVQCYGDYMQGNVLGNVNEKSLKEIWHDQPFIKLRKLMKSGKRLSTKPCRICSDGGLIEEKMVMIDRRKIKAVQYVNQRIDINVLTDIEKRNEA